MTTCRSEAVPAPILIHVTAHTGHVRESRRSEVEDLVASRLRFLLAASCMSEDPVNVGVRGWSIVAQEEPGALSVRVLGPHGLVTSVFAVGADDEAASRTAWGDVVANSLWLIKGASPATPPLDAPPDPPWLVGAMLPPILAHPEAAGWLADLERCAAWAWLDLTEHAVTSRAGKQTVEDIACADAWLLDGLGGVPA